MNVHCTARRVRCLCLLPCALGLILSPGCSSLSVSTLALPSWADLDKPQQPGNVIAIWQDTVAHESGKRPMRGFTGKLIFYGLEKEKPVKVEGSLMIYAFDEAGRTAADVKPDRKFVFTEEQWASHYRKTKLGPAYTVWIPWDEAGGPKKEISMIARFVPRGGRVVVSEQAKALLPGPPSLDEAAAETNRQSSRAGVGESRIQRVSYEPERIDATDKSLAAQQGATAQTTTIPVPSHFGGNLAGTSAPVQLGGRQLLAAPSTAGAPTSAATVTYSSPPGSPAMATTATQSAVPSTTGTPSNAPSTHSSLDRRQAPNGPIVLPGRGHGPSRLRHGESPSAPASSPASATALGSASNSPGVPTSPR